MKVCICTKWKDYDASHTGKGFFAARLAKELRNQGVEIVTPDVFADINLAIGKLNYEHNAKKLVLRLGAAHIDTNSDYKKLNGRKAKALKKADGIVYQSEFSTRLCHAFIGKPDCPERVIFNGADPKEFEVEPFKSPFKYNFLASAREWTPQKRLDTIIEAFIKANIEDSCLWVCGSVSKNSRIYCKLIGGGIVGKKGYEIENLGIVDQPTLASLYKRCNAMVDLTWLSACPNNIVEAIVAGLPIIGTAEAGTRELLGGDMYTEYDFKPVNLRKPPEVDVNILANAIRYEVTHECEPLRESIRERLYISNIAKQYLDFFKRLLEQ